MVEEKKEKVIKGLGDGKEGKRKRVKEGKEREVWRGDVNHDNEAVVAYLRSIQ